MSKRQSNTGQSQGTSPGRMNYKSHGKSLSFHGSRLLPLQRETDVEGARSWHHRQQVFQARIGDPPYSLPCVCSPGLRHPYPPTPLPHPSASRGCTRACLNKLVITTLRKPDEPTAAGARLLQEVPSVDLLIEGHLEQWILQSSLWYEGSLVAACGICSCGNGIYLFKINLFILIGG